MTETPLDIFHRPRRRRLHPGIRRMVRETALSPADFILPMFVDDTLAPGETREVSSMPGVFRLGLDAYRRHLELVSERGVPAVLLFGIPRDKDPLGTGSRAQDGVVQRALQVGKSQYPDLVFMADVCLCEYTDHGHCGPLDEKGIVKNDEAVAIHCQTALSLAEAGADMVAPSDMMDGRIGAIRDTLDEKGFTDTGILSYAVKYASSFYGPFRDAADSAPSSGDRHSYQMDPANSREAMIEASLDVQEGADMLMVKPAMPYLDIITRLSEAEDLPLAAYQVSGEYAMLKAAAQNGWLDYDAVLMESLLCIKRAGADMIITYAALEAAALCG